MTKGALVSYGSAGICRIIDISKEAILGKTVECYVLSPLNDERTTIFVPTDNKTLVGRMHPIMSLEEVHTLILSMPSEQETWIEDERARSSKFREILNGGTRSELIRMMKSLHSKKMELAKVGKRLRASDNAFLTKAELTLYGEVAYVLGIPVDDVEDYITNTLEA